MAIDPLSNDSILSHMANALPTHPADSTASDISSSYEVIALFCHACMIAVDFRLLGFHEDQSIEAEVQALAPRLKDTWNAGYGAHSFYYAHPQSSMRFVIKVDRLGKKAEIRGIGVGDDRILRFEVIMANYVESSRLPLRITMRDGVEDRSDLPEKLRGLFSAPLAMNELGSMFKHTIIQKLMPGLNKEGYEENRSSQVEQIHTRIEQQAQAARLEALHRQPAPEPARPRPYNDPIAPPPRRPVVDFPPPGFDDEYEMNRPPGMPFVPPGRAPFNIGHDDLNPPGLAPYDPLRGSLAGGPRWPSAGGGMHPTFDDPMFGGQAGAGYYDPSAPPGARYDPVGPGGAPRGSGSRRPGGPGGNYPGFPGGGSNPYGGDII